MTNWADVERDAPAFADRVRAVFAAGTNKTLATLRADGSPRISGTELEIGEGRVTLGMMPASRKLADVRRDPRVALHSPTLEPPAPDQLPGDAKISGVLRTTDPTTPLEGTFFEVDIAEVVLTRVENDELVIESWHPGRGLERVRRK